MNKILERPILFILILSALAAYLFFFRLGGMALTDPDETFYAQTSKEMLGRQECLTPYLYDKPQFEKPFLFYGLVEWSFKIFGVNEFAARLPSAKSAFLGLIAIYVLGALLFNKRVGALSAIILATNVEYVVLSRACVTDMVLSTFMLLGVLFFFCGYLKEKGYFYLLSSAMFALATLTKGPVFIILPATAIFIYLILSGDLKAVKKMPIFQSVLVFIVIAAPWYILMYKLHGKAFIDSFFGFHNVTRFLESEHRIGSQAYYNIPIVFGGFFPWSVFLPFGFWHAFKRAFLNKGQEDKRLIFILSWFFVIFIFFTISSTKLPTYIFPSFISLAIITAVFWDDFLRKAAPKGVISGMNISYYLLLAAIVFGAIGVLTYINFKYPFIVSSAFMCAVFLIFGFSLSLAAFISKKFIWTFFLIAYSLAIFAYPLLTLVLPQLEPYETSKAISQKLLSLMKPEERLGSESNYLAGLAFYTGKIPTDIDKHHLLVQFLSSKERVWCVMKEKNHRELYELDTKPYYTRPSYMLYKIGKRAIVTNIVPSGAAYILKRERR